MKPLTTRCVDFLNPFQCTDEDLLENVCAVFKCNSKNLCTRAFSFFLFNISLELWNKEALRKTVIPSSAQWFYAFSQLHENSAQPEKQWGNTMTWITDELQPWNEVIEEEKFVTGKRLASKIHRPCRLVIRRHLLTESGLMSLTSSQCQLAACYWIRYEKQTSSTTQTRKCLDRGWNMSKRPGKGNHGRASISQALFTQHVSTDWPRLKHENSCTQASG